MPKKKETEVPIINADQAAQLDPGPELAEKGWKRDDQLAERKDRLEEAAERAGEEREIYAFDPAAIDPDNEILQLQDELYVDNAQDGFEYCWVYEGHRGQEIVRKKRLGWSVVQSADPESPDLKDARGYRVIGDCILMRTTVEQKRKIDAYYEKIRKEREGNVGSRLVELGEKYAGHGFKVHKDASRVPIGNNNLMDVMETSAKRQGARQTAMKGVDRMLREGTVPNMPPTGKRGG